MTACHRSSLLIVVLAGCAPGEAAKTDSGLPPSEGTDWFAPVDAPVAGEWPQFRLEVRHTGVAPEGSSIGADPDLRWTSEAFAIGEYSASKSSVTLSDTLALVGVDDGHLIALDRETGEERWRFRTNRAELEADYTEDELHRGIHGTAATDGETVWIGDYSGWLYAVDHDTGALIWEQDLGGSIGASPVLHQGHIFMAVEFGTPDGKVFVVDGATGGLWYETEYLGNHPHSSVSIDPERGLMFIGANNGRFAAFDFVNREHLWDAWMDEKANGEGRGDIKTTAAVGPDAVYISSWDQKVHAYDIPTGEELWSYETGAYIMSSPSFHDNTVFVGSHDSHLYALDASPGLDESERLKWRTSLGRTILSSPTVVPADGTVLVGDNDGELGIYDLDDGTELWVQRLEGRMSGVPTVTGSSLFAFDATGITWRYDAP